MVRCLLDTHTLAWWLMDSPKLPINVRRLLEDADNVVFVSTISAYEMSLKHHRGRWPEVGPLVGAFEEVVAAEGFDLLPLSARHAIRAGSYGREHRDPFDRMLAAQAIVEDFLLVTDDKGMEVLGAKTLWRA